MSKETISPAPWHDNGNEIVDGNGKVIGGAFSNEDGTLMAAAPELLALLVESQSFIGGDWRERRDAVVAKVTGAQS